MHKDLSNGKKYKIGIQIEDNIVYTVQFPDDQAKWTNEKDNLKYMVRKLKEK